MLVDYIIFNTRIKEIKFIANIRNKIPDRVLSIIASFLIILVISSIIS